ncbi:hypothetical protein ABE096_16645 [Robertmurraya massiliosenegalensis]|uniref:hypothetical protein n=1 Tax=Robertmurraya TaxID=2837507 RepID=UPI0039A5D2C2
MKKILVISLLQVALLSSTAQALEWAYPFVVWKGNVYEVKQEEMIKEDEIGKIIGKVKTSADDMTGEYYGDASNYYPKGTEYYEIKGTSTSTAIAVRDNEQWMNAVYVHEAPFHIMNVVFNYYFIAAILIIAIIVVTVTISKQKK